MTQNTSSAVMAQRIETIRIGTRHRKDMGDLAALDGAKSLVMTALDFLHDPELRERTRNVFEHSEAR